VLSKPLLPVFSGGGGAAEPPDANLPEGWAMALDPNGKPYYWHKATQKTQWDKPTA